ncbi:MAG: DUF721 domain-containing protein [Bacteroidota bacterium]
MKHQKKDKRTSNLSTVGEALNEMMRTYQLKPRFDELQLVAKWSELMGKTISSKTGKVFVRNEILMVEINSAPLKHELTMSKSKVMERIESEFGTSIIKDIIFI